MRHSARIAQPMTIPGLARFNAYRAHPDPFTASANTFALVLAGDGPFYPLYLYFLIGRGFWPSLIALWVVPVYALIPWLARRHSLAARMVLMVASIANTTLYTVLFGAGARLQLFLLPCIALGLFFHHRERYLAWALGGIALGMFMWLRMAGFAPIRPFSAADYRAMATLTSLSVATLSWFLLVLFGSMIHAALITRPTAADAALLAPTA
jgi:hypothetical protein